MGEKEGLAREEGCVRKHVEMGMTIGCFRVGGWYSGWSRGLVGEAEGGEVGKLSWVGLGVALSVGIWTFSRGQAVFKGSGAEQ